MSDIETDDEETRPMKRILLLVLLGAFAVLIIRQIRTSSGS
jgi:hypothetical protein